jgi:SPP1 gp7 family putative phage head morphogenesis protein
VKPSHADELWYRGVLLGIVRQGAQAVESELLPVLALYTQGQDSVRLSAADATPRRELDDLFKRLGQRFRALTANAGAFAAGAAERARKNTDARLAENIRRSVAIDIRPLLGNSPSLTAAMGAAVRTNVDLIKSIPDQYLARVREATEKNLAAGKRYTDIAKEIQQIDGITERRAKIIARDQVSKMNSDFNRIRQQEAGITHYTWQTSNDERVRESHAELDGLTFSWDAPPEEGHPGEDILCRCVAVPLLDIDEHPQPQAGSEPEAEGPDVTNFLEIAKGKPSVATLTGNELAMLEGESVRDAAKRYYENELMKNPAYREGFGKVNFHKGSGWKKFLSTSLSSPERLKLLPAVKQVIEKGEYIGKFSPGNKGIPRKKNIAAYHHFAANVEILGGKKFVGVTVIEDVFGNRFYNLTEDPDILLKKKKSQRITDGSSGGRSALSRICSPGSLSSTDSIGHEGFEINLRIIG